MNKIKNLLVTCLFGIILLSGCTFIFGANEKTPKPIPPSKPEPPEGMITLFDGSDFNFSLVRSGNASNACADAVSGLCDEVALLCASDKLVAYSDADEIPAAAQPNEIMVGDVNRVKAQDALAEIAESFCFLIEVSETSIVIAGSSEKYVLKGIEYFTQTYLEENTVADGSAIFIKTGKYVSESATPTLGEYVKFCTDRQQTVEYSINKSFTYAPSDLIKTNHVLQGFCLSADGKYMFIALHNGGDGTSSILSKYDMSTGKIIKSNKSPDCDHANDICYIPQNDTIAVVHNTPNVNSVSIYKASDLSYVKTVTLTIKIHSLSYDADNQRFVAGISSSKDDFAILDADFKVVKKYSFNSAGGVHQGGDCDSEYIYFVQSAKSGGAATNILVVYDWQGNKIAVIPLPEVSYEVEGITHAGTDFYLGFYRGYSLKGGEFYKLSVR